MTVHFSLDTITKMNTILNKELEQLGEYKSISSLRYGKENKETRDTFASQSIASTDLTKSTISLGYNGGISGRSSNYNRHSNPVKVFENHQISTTDNSNKNRMMQRELITLHSRVLDLEKQVNEVSNNNASENLRKSYLSCGNNSSIHIHDSNRVSNYTGTHSPKKTGTIGGLNRSILRSSATKFGGDSGPLRESSLGCHNRLKLSGSSTEEFERKANEKSVSYSTKKRLERSAIKQALRRELADTDDSSGNEKSNCSGYITGRSGKSASKGRKKTQSVSYQSYDFEAATLQKRIVTMKKEFNEDRAALVKERILGKEIAENIRKMAMKVRRMGTKLDNIEKTEMDYERLVENFNKSEQIRNQQRYLIGNLNYEVTLLKAEKDKFVVKEEKGQRNASGNRHNVGQKKDKKKVRKVF